MSLGFTRMGPSVYARKGVRVLDARIHKDREDPNIVFNEKLLPGGPYLPWGAFEIHHKVERGDCINGGSSTPI